MTTLVFDIETDGLLDSLTKIHCICLAEVDAAGEIVGDVELYGPERVADGLERLAGAVKIVGHNIVGFDIPALEKALGNPQSLLWGTGNVAVFDTLLASRLIWSDIKDKDFSFRARNPDFPGKFIGSHGLKAWGYRLGVLKGDFHEDTDWSTYTPEMGAYCQQDVRVTAKLYARVLAQNYSAEALELEHQFARIIRQQEEFGFPFDKAAAVELYGKLSERRGVLQTELAKSFAGWSHTMKTPSYWRASYPGVGEGTQPTKAKAIAGLRSSVLRLGGKIKDIKVEPGPLKEKHTAFNPTSRDHIAQALMEKYNWKPEKLTDKGKPQVDEAALEGLEWPEAKLLQELLMIQKRIGMLAEGKEAWLKLETNGRIYGSVITNGAVTGRCTHRHPNVAQVPSVRSPYGADCRGLFTAAPGWVLVGCDASGLELRCLAHFMARYDDGEYAKEVTEGDVHTRNQEAAGLPSRDTAKTFIYAFLYGAGPDKIGAIVNSDRTRGEGLQASFLEKTPALAQLLPAVKRACGFMPTHRNNKEFWVKDPHATKRYLKGLDGRHLHIRSAHAALNTLLQSAGALVMKRALVLFVQHCTTRGMAHGWHYGLCANIHDEVQFSCPKELADDLGKLFVQSIREAGESFNMRCPMDGEYKVGRNWAETH